ncbi:MAG: hypothetical protein H0X38_00585 [Planctomycetes bacterium]|nr:hypothetical protein [Planctomycetota bacterium]
MFADLFGQAYDVFAASESISGRHKIFGGDNGHFKIRHGDFCPLEVPLGTPNLVLRLTLQPKPLG